MPDKKLFQAVTKNINKFEVRLENYIIPPPQASKYKNDNADGIAILKISKDHAKGASKSKSDIKLAKLEKRLKDEKSQHLLENNQETLQEGALREKNKIAERYAVFADKQTVEQPKLCIWFYMSEENVSHLLNLTSKQKIRETIDNNMKLEYPKGISRLLAIELMYSVVRFCQKSNFSIIQSGTLLSIFYLSHEYFLSSFYTTAGKIYSFFKEYMLLHCFECPPDSMELFNYSESTQVVRYFCKTYLQNLPLIRLLTLPSFGFYLNYEKQPDPFEEMGKKEKVKKKGK